MRKTTEELWKQAGGNSLTDYGVECVETFRRLCIENERESAEAVAKANGNGMDIEWNPAFSHHLRDGAEIFTFPPAAIDRDSVIEECWQAIEEIDDGEAPEYRACQEAIRALKSQLAAPDPRDEALKLARDALSSCKKQQIIHEYAPAENYKVFDTEKVQEAFAAIDKVIGEK